ncbi:ABC transporter substrate-binding protein [Streptomyces sp. ODS28]|uniref:ABC transporter substrate-binding protein n=1 Tax=Streptomyces sp. ODS28 TaxID=3136688 RepID=UPI0031EA6BB5
MSTRRPVRRALSAALLLPALLAAVSGCGTAAPAEGGGPAPLPTKDVVSAARKDPKAARLLPASVREKGTLRLASSVGSPPSSAYLDDGRTVVGQDIDFADAAARVLGLKLQREEAGFEAILPALGSGKYDLGTGNFGVTDDRRRSIDFVTYINDGQGFAVREDSALKKVTSLTQLCGKTVATGAGTTFEKTLEDHRAECAKAGKKPYSVKTYAETSAPWAALQQGRADVVMSTINGVRYAVKQQQGLRFLNEYKRLDVGFALKKHSPLAPALQAAVERLKKDGTYDRILEKWGTTPSAIDRSRISPPEKK